MGKEKVEKCKVCKKQPVIGGALFMGHHVECCNCGITIPFPPAATREKAIEEWNKEQR